MRNDIKKILKINVIKKLEAYTIREILRDSMKRYIDVKK
jgi:hypothetical protein